MNYYKQTDKSNTYKYPAHHEGEGVFKICPLFDKELSLPIKMQIWTLNPGDSEGDHTHGDDDTALEEFYYFLEGTGTMYINKEEIPIKPGDTFLVPPNIAHGFKNTGDSILKVFIIWGLPDESLQNSKK